MSSNLKKCIQLAKEAVILYPHGDNHLPFGTELPNFSLIEYKHMKFPKSLIESMPKKGVACS